MSEPNNTSRPHVELTGYDAQGKPLSASVPANTDPTAVQDNILHKGGRVLSSHWTAGDRVSPKGISLLEFARFNEMLATAVGRGIPMPTGVQKLALTFRSGVFRTSLKHVNERLEQGRPLKESFDPERAKFPRLYGALLDAGTAAGNLPQVLLGLSRNIRIDVEFRRAVLQACIYPWFLIIVALSILAVLMPQLLPLYAPLSSKLSVSLPWLLDAAKGGAPGVRLLVLVLIIVGVLAVLWAALMRYRIGRPLTELAARRLPFFNTLYLATAWSSFADTLALLLRSKVPMPLALRLAGPATGADWLASVSEQLAVNVESGRSLSSAASGVKGLPSRIIHAFETGESERDPAKALQATAERYRREADHRVRNIVRYLPPALSVVLGLMVLSVAVLTLGPFIRMLGGAW